MRKMRKRLNETQEGELVERFTKGEGRKALALSFGVSEPTVARVIRNHEAQRGKLRKLTPEQEADVLRRYAAGESQRAIGDSVGLSQSNVGELLKRHQVVARHENAPGATMVPLEDAHAYWMAHPFATDSEVGNHFGVAQATATKWRDQLGLPARRGCAPHNVAFFDTYTRESCYWAGFLAADGNVGKKQAVIQVTLHPDDQEHLEAFRRCSGLEAVIRPVMSGGREYRKIHLNSPQWKEALGRQFNVAPAKSLILQPPPAVLPSELVHHFVRGFFDGDGHANAGGNHLSFACASQSFRDWLGQVCGAPTRIHNLTSSDFCKSLYYGGKLLVDTIRVTRFMYADSTPDTRLDRKYQRLLRHLTPR